MRIISVKVAELQEHQANTLDDGVLGFEEMENKLAIGDGVTPWDDLENLLNIKASRAVLNNGLTDPQNSNIYLIEIDKPCIILEIVQTLQAGNYTRSVFAHFYLAGCQNIYNAEKPYRNQVSRTINGVTKQYGRFARLFPTKTYSGTMSPAGYISRNFLTIEVLPSFIDSKGGAGTIQIDGGLIIGERAIPSLLN